MIRALLSSCSLLRIHSYICCLALSGFVLSVNVQAEVSNSGDALDISYPALIRKLESGVIAPSELVELTIGTVEQLNSVPEPISQAKIQNSEFRQILGEKLVERISKILTAESSAKTVALKSLAEVFLPTNDKHRQAINHIIELVERAEHLTAIADGVELVQMRSELKSSQEKYVLEKRITEVLEKLAQDEMSNNAPYRSLLFLAQIDSAWWNDSHREAAVLALEKIAKLITKQQLKPQQWPFSEGLVKQMIDKVVVGDKAVAATVADVYAWWVLVLVSQNKIQEVRHYYDEVIRLRPDPNVANDDMRFSIALMAKSPESRDFAQGRLVELELAGEFSFLRKLRLLFNGYYGKLFPICLTIALICAVFFSVVTLARINLPYLKIPRLFPQRAVSGYKVPMEELDEYSRLLRFFELDDSASEDDIKKAYRQKMKDSHPDLAGATAAGEQSANPDDFMMLKSAYERILEIRKSRFGH